MRIFNDKERPMAEETLAKIEDIVLSTGNVNRKYIVRDLVFCSDQLKVDIFATTTDLDELFTDIKMQLKAKALSCGADAVINCHFEYDQKQVDGQLVTDVFASGTIIQFTPTTIG